MRSPEKQIITCLVVFLDCWRFAAAGKLRLRFAWLVMLLLPEGVVACWLNESISEDLGFERLSVVVKNSVRSAETKAHR
jgi:hypothetical protein